VTQRQTATGHDGILEPPDLALVIVTYHSRPQVAALLAGLDDALPVVVVDNSDGSDGLPRLIAGRANATYLSGGGIGYARAANLGARAASAEVLVFVNPDTRPTSEDLIALARDVATDPRCAASAAVCVDEDGRPLIVGGWEFSVRRAAVFAAGLHKIFPRAGVYARPRAGEFLGVDWVNGSVMAVRRETFEALGGFDSDLYLYCDDVAFARVAREHGMFVRLRPDIPVNGTTGGSGAPRLEMMRLRGASLSHYVRKYHGRPRGTAIRAAIAAGYAVRTVAYLLVLRRPRRAREHWAYAVGAATARATVAGRVVFGR
jgi:N-acetylglucosaminyl-diphospho-decaprenol L-rhamnosyltransferase